ncbi:E3 ubiquitin-protein ligase SINA-like 10 [Sesamum alatum]|uniref:RING-type E3 ubiquitin transferase n=1 Tax=Sesamum alatum TaxID=300844 RepID=A0AAE2CLH6_9LAMI|nr:E3 ubiquitin-protein ligase SINA-like 10 [Sesamum alatum]
MARFSVGGDDDGNEEGSSNNRPLPKRPRTSVPIVYTLKRASASSANSGGRAASSNSQNPLSTGAAPQPPLEREFRPEEPTAVDEESEEESDEESDSELSDSSEEESEEEEEEILRLTPDPLLVADQLNLQIGVEVQPTEAQVNSDSTGNGTGRGSVAASGDASAPVSVTLADPDVLDCPICLEPLSPPVYQCENGHIACSSCCIKMRNKCASCCWPIGYNRCRALEKVLESIRVSCRNMQHGCTESLNYSKKLDHEKTCKYAPCSCPHPDCNYVGLPKCLYTHFATQHSRSSTQFRFNYGFPISLDNSQTHAFLQEKTESILFILNRSFESLGSFVNVMCIASTSSKREFSYELTARDGFSSIKLNTMAESTTQWITQPPVKKCVLVPNDFITSAGQLKLEITIWKDHESPIASSRCSSLLQTPT